MKNLFTSLSIVVLSALVLPTIVNAQQGEWIAFLGVNRAQYQTNPSADDQVKRYKGYDVTGRNMVLYGNNITDVFTNNGVGKNMNVMLDASTQEFSVLFTDKKKVIILSWNEVDSFYVKIDSTDLTKQPTTYINGTQFGEDNKYFMERILQTENITLYKTYSTDLRTVQGSLVDDGRRVFEMENQYSYTTSKNPMELMPIKNNFKGLVPDKVNKKDANKVLEDRMFPKESRLKLYFEEFGKYY